jgi:hypothetical protein
MTTFLERHMERTLRQIVALLDEHRNEYSEFLAAFKRIDARVVEVEAISELTDDRLAEIKAGIDLILVEIRASRDESGRMDDRVRKLERKLEMMQQ